MDATVTDKRVPSEIVNATVTDKRVPSEIVDATVTDKRGTLRDCGCHSY